MQSSVEPMQVDAPPEENENVEEEHFIVESTSLVSALACFNFYFEETFI